MYSSFLQQLGISRLTQLQLAVSLTKSKFSLNKVSGKTMQEVDKHMIFNNSSDIMMTFFRWNSGTSRHFESGQ